MKAPAKVMLLLVCLLSCALAAVAQTPEKQNSDDSALKDLNRRVADYLKVHQAAQSEIHRLKPTKSSEAITQHEHDLAHRIREHRNNAVQGNIFTPGIAEVFRRLLGITLQGPQGVSIRQALLPAALLKTRAIRVNGPYPDGIPLASTPPTLLQNLPVLPQGIEYRVVGHNLVLRDADANLVVDFMSFTIL